MTTQTATAAAQPIPVYVAGNTTVHAGRKIGTYENGRPRFAKLCSRPGRDLHDPMPGAPGETVITCKRCLAKLDQLAARTAQAAREATPFETTSNPTEETTMSNPTAPITEKPADEPRDPEFLAAVAEATAEPAKSTKPAVEPAKLVEQVAKATRLRGLAVEPRQNGSRHVITITDGAGKRILAYVDPLKRGTGFRVEVANYGGYKTATVEDIAAAAELVKGSERRQPKAAKKPAAKKPAAKKPAAKKPAAKKSAAKKAAPKAKTAETR